VCDWIESKPWDGKSRLKDLYATVHVDGDTAMRDLLLYRWLLSCVAAVFLPFGFESHGALVFTGAQGQGKTRWVKRLVPTEMHDVVLAGAVLDPANKDTIINAVSHWLVELGELDATFRKADIARLKSFITNSIDKLRRPYDRIESEYQRRTVFFASVNKGRYLVDDTKNRRWWTVATTGVDYQHGIDMQQVWAELLMHFKRGERWHLSAEEQDMLQVVNAEHENVEPIEELIRAAFEWDEPVGLGHEMTATEVLLAIGFDKPNKGQATQVSEFLRAMTGKEPKHKAKGRYFTLPSKPRSMQKESRKASNQDGDDEGPFGWR
jgi:putative DNA primase/helicase